MLVAFGSIKRPLQNYKFDYIAIKIQQVSVEFKATHRITLACLGAEKIIIISDQIHSNNGGDEEGGVATSERLASRESQGEIAQD